MTDHENSANAQPGWHPCDQFIDPLAALLKPLVENKHPTKELTEDRLLAPWSFLNDDRFLVGKYWLELNVSPQYAEAFAWRVAQVAEALNAWCCEALALEYDVDTEALIWTVNPKLKGTAVAKQLLGEWAAIHAQVSDLHYFLIFLSNYLRKRVSFEPLVASPHFVPTELQREILDALAGRALTADQLEGHLAVSRSTLYGGKKKAGGLNGLTKLGWICNDRKVGGYYRPDLPPRRKSN